MRIIKRAKLEVWPKLWHNLRATRQTELMERFSSHVVCKWMGNSRAIAQEHYLQVTEEHYEQATMTTDLDKKKATQNATQQPAESSVIEGNGEQVESSKPLVFPNDSAQCSSKENIQWAVQGSNL
jgi:hypothetical protein